VFFCVLYSPCTCKFVSGYFSPRPLPRSWTLLGTSVPHDPLVVPSIVNFWLCRTLLWVLLSGPIIINFIIRRQNATKYNSWHAGQVQPTAGLARANKPPNTTVKLLMIQSAHRPSPRKHSPDGAIWADSLLIYRPRKEKRLSWPSWLTCSGRFTHIRGRPSTTGRAQDTEGSPADVLTLCYATNRLNWLASDLLCVMWDIKLYSLAHS